MRLKRDAIRINIFGTLFEEEGDKSHDEHQRVVDSIRRSSPTGQGNEVVEA